MENSPEYMFQRWWVASSIIIQEKQHKYLCLELLGEERLKAQSHK